MCAQIIGSRKKMYSFDICRLGLSFGLRFDFGFGFIDIMILLSFSNTLLSTLFLIIKRGHHNFTPLNVCEYISILN